MSWLRFVGRRMLFAAVLVFVSSSLSLVLTRMAPGDVGTELQFEGVPAATIAAERARLALDRPLVTQYVDWVVGAVRFDFGQSFRYSRPVASLVLERGLNTVLLASAALLLAAVVGLPLGVFTASHPHSSVARLVQMGSVTALSLPPMILSLTLAAVAARTGWLPVGGMRSPVGPPGPFAQLWDLVSHLVLPTLALAVPVAATLERFQSRSLATALGAPCLRAATARGVPTRRVNYVHGLRLALTPVVSVLGVVAGSLLGGSFGVEIVTAWPGLGRLMYEALMSRDLYLVAGCATLGAALVAFAAFLSDVTAAWNDPRLRSGAET